MGFFPSKADFIMSGRGGRFSGRGGCGNNDHGGRGHGRGQNYTGATKTSRYGLCSALSNNVFDYGQMASADQMHTSWKKMVQYVGTN
jgi:hypothetical protein